MRLLHAGFEEIGGLEEEGGRYARGEACEEVECWTAQSALRGREKGGKSEVFAPGDDFRFRPPSDMTTPSFLLFVVVCSSRHLLGGEEHIGE